MGSLCISLIRVRSGVVSYVQAVSFNKKWFKLIEQVHGNIYPMTLSGLSVYTNFCGNVNTRYILKNLFSLPATF
jgi:hypothetical protein